MVRQHLPRAVDDKRKMPASFQVASFRASRSGDSFSWIAESNGEAPMNKISRTYLILAGILLAGIAPSGATAAAPAEKLSAPGLTEPVEIIRDHWGISHIYAKNEHDLFFAQGYNAARDRLFELEIFRRRSEGTVAEILGKKELNRDIGARQFMFRGDMDKELAMYHPHGRAIVEAFISGVNAYIDQTVKNPALLTPEFQMLGIKPGKWTLASMLGRLNSVGLGHANEEMQIAMALRDVGAEKVRDLEYFQPANPDLKIDPAIDTSLLNKSILDTYDAWLSSVKITPDELLPPYRRNTKTSALADRMTELARLEEGGAPDTGTGTNTRTDTGSNNWLVSGKLTMSGFPIVVGDPHRDQESPSLRYWVHLVAPGWNVIGGGEPMLPGVSIGHNEYGAWELTSFGTASEDVYVYDINPANPDQYKYKDGWEEMKKINETIPVKGEAAQHVVLKFTRHGPVVFEDMAHHKAYAVRTTYLDPGSAPYISSLRMDQARNWTEFEDAASYAQLPAENYIWGDRDGHVGYQAVGATPLRPNWSGLVPVPGDGRYEWVGLLPIKDLPHILDPDKGYYNTSNDYQIPTGNLATSWPNLQALHYTWADPFRAQSVAEVLGSGKRFTVADMIQLQNNDLSIPARSMVPLLRDVTITNPASQKAADRLLHWNFVLDKDSVEAGIYEMFQRHLIQNVRAIVVPVAARADITVPMIRTVALVTAPDGSFGADSVAGRNAVLAKSLDQAVADLTQRFGPDMEKWTLGAYHHARIMHPMSEALTPELEAKFDVGQLPRGGDAYSITATGGGDNQLGGGSFKNIFDTENWDNSVGLSNPGQSGDVNDPHYRDLYELWARGKYFPVFFSRSKIESVAEKDITLLPQ
jgi:penicillin G amidase